MFQRLEHRSTNACRFGARVHVFLISQPAERKWPQLLGRTEQVLGRTEQVLGAVIVVRSPITGPVFNCLPNSEQGGIERSCGHHQRYFNVESKFRKVCLRHGLCKRLSVRLQIEAAIHAVRAWFQPVSRLEREKLDLPLCGCLSMTKPGANRILNHASIIRICRQVLVHHRAWARR